MSIQIADINQDTVLTATDKQKLTLFRGLVEKLLGGQTPPGSDWKNISMFHLCESAGIDLTSLAKEGQMLCALWIIVLRGIQKYLPESELKYPTFESFKEAYDSMFPRDEESELQNLWHTANWMYILFQLIPAKKNKGLAMLVVPRFVEGWQVKYVTGSGQTHFTANRVRVFETEGETKACHRGKIKAKPKKKAGGPRRQRSTGDEDGSGGSGDDSDEGQTVHYTMQHRELSMATADYTHHRKRKVRHVVPRESSSDTTEEDLFDHNTRSRQAAAKKARMDSLRMPPPPIPGRCTTDVLRSAANPEFCEAYKEFQQSEGAAAIQRDETSLLIPDLMRSESWANNPNNAPPPVKAERNVTWGEIPLNLGSSFMQSGSSLSNFAQPSFPAPFTPVVPVDVFQSPEAPSAAAPPVYGTDKLSEVFGTFMAPMAAPSAIPVADVAADLFAFRTSSSNDLNDPRAALTSPNKFVHA